MALHRGTQPDFSVGKTEFCFVAVRQGQPFYPQVAYLLSTPEVLPRECAPLLGIPDQYPKLLLTLDRFFTKSTGTSMPMQYSNTAMHKRSVSGGGFGQGI